MKFIISNNLNEASPYIDKAGALLLKGVPEDDIMSSRVRLSEDYLCNPSNVFEYAYRHKSKVRHYLEEISDTENEIWTGRAISMLPDLYCIGYNSPPDKKIKSTTEDNFYSWAFAMLDRISEEYFLIFPEARRVCSITGLPSVLLRKNGFVLQDLSKEQFIFGTMNLIDILDSLKKEMFNKTKNFQQSSIENEQSFVFLLEKDLFSRESVARLALTALINIISQKIPDKIDIINQTGIPLGSVFDMEDMTLLAVRGYITELDEQDNLKIYTK